MNEEDDNGEDRPVYEWGPTCPVELVDSAHTCKPFKLKHNGCQSVVSETMARNYLAKHIFDSSNHPQCGNKSAAFDRANSELIRYSTETARDWQVYREYYADYRAQNERRKEQRKRSRERRERDRSRDRSRVLGAVGKASAKGDGKGESHGAAIGAPLPAPPLAPPMMPPPGPAPAIGAMTPAQPTFPPPLPSQTTNDSALVQVDTSRRVKVPLRDLQMLEGCIGRSIDSQKRTIDSLGFFIRQLEDELKIFTEAKNVLAELIFKARMARS